MESAHDRYSDQFYQWERRGRGWQIFGSPVRPEPQFRPFIGHYLPQAPGIDDGRRPTVLSSLFRKLTAQPEVPPDIPVPEEEPQPMPFERDVVVELQMGLPADLDK